MRPRVTQAIALLLCAAFIAAAGSRVSAINTGRKALNVWGSESPVENTPPEYAFAIQAFGAFRGLITDMAFMRAEQFKSEGRFYDAMQLHKWICTLQPHFPAVWEYAAWNMSWNISVTTFTPQERWNWVYNGVKLLRDQGIQFNPGAVNLYKQLAWTFNNKMSEVTDEFHYAYKCAWAYRMHLLLGPPQPPFSEVKLSEFANQMKDTGDTDQLLDAAEKARRQHEIEWQTEARERGLEFISPDYDPTAGPKTRAEGLSARDIAQQAALNRIHRLIDAPKTLDELYQRFPEARDMVSRLNTIGVTINSDTLAEARYWQPSGLAFTFFRPYRNLSSSPVSITALSADDQPEDDLSQRQAELDEILGISTKNTAGDALVAFLQRKVLRDVYKMDAGHMLYVVENFGPVDWRSVDSQGLYWVTLGLIRTGESYNDFRSDKTNTARILFFCMRNLFLRNSIIFEPWPDPENIHLSYLTLGIDLNFIEPMHQAYLRYGPLFDPRPGMGTGAGATYRSGHFNFLTEAIRLLYLAGQEDEAARYYRYIQDTYATTPTGQPNLAVTKNLHDFVMDSFIESSEVPGLREISILVDGLLYNAFHELGNGNAARFVKIVGRARDFYEKYMSGKRGRGYERVALPSFKDMQIDVFREYLGRPPISHIETIEKVRLWRVAPLYLRQATYDDLLPVFQTECQAWGFAIEKAFPTPPNMDEYREQHPDRRRKTRESNVETLIRPPG